MDLRADLKDPTLLVKDHSLYAHLGCVALRCLIGLYFFFMFTQSMEEKVFFSILFGSLLIFFLYKFIRVKNTWKAYARIVLTLSLSILLMWKADKETARIAVGTLLIADALIGLQSRHTATLLSRQT